MVSWISNGGKSTDQWSLAELNESTDPSRPSSEASSVNSASSPETFEAHQTVHIPVMMEEVLAAMDPQPGAVLVDGTMGGGGHTREMALRVAPSGFVVGVDRDPLAVERTSARLNGLPVRVAVANYADIPEVLDALEIDQVDGILLDLGLSSDQLAERERGFSYQSDGELDLRFDPTTGQPAWLLVQKMSEAHLADLIYQYGEERFSRRIARKIVEQRRTHPIRTSQQLAELVRKCVPRSKNHSIDPATRTFQALRIAVNEELKWLEVALRRLPTRLKPGGRLVIISFHSLEDRLVKNAFRDDVRLDPSPKKLERPKEEEIAVNFRARSSRLRVAIRNDRAPDDIYTR
jgi:16S rRNA (cytosine1402-N4)-methyltransferase